MATSFRLSDEAIAFLAELADSQGISRQAMLEILIRKAWTVERSERDVIKFYRESESEKKAS